MDSFTLEKLEFDRVREILARYCRCPLGAALAGRIGPSRRPETIHRWLEETTQMVLAIRQQGPPPLGGVTDIGESLRRASPGGGADGEDFAAIASTLEAAGSVRLWGGRLAESAPLVAELPGRLGDFSEQVGLIRGVVDARGAVMDAASDALARIRRAIAGTRQRIHEVIYGFVRRSEVARILQNPTVTLHDDRLVLPVKAEHRHMLPGVVHRASHTGATLFVEPAESVELNNRLVELSDQERREVARLLNDLAIALFRRHEDIVHALHALAQVDLLAAKAQYATEFEFTAPEMTERGGLQLNQVRHPLLIEQVFQGESRGQSGPVRQAVPIDVRLGVDFDVLIITGSNTGGKTVALKTIGLAAVMAQSGLHIPAQRGSTLPVFRDVLLDVGDEQSLQQSLSTFGAHVRRVNHILRRADRYSLVLLDELRGIGCLSMVTTHLGALKAYAINHPRADNASVEFDTRTLRPTYHLRIGEPGESHAITVAAAMGLPKQLIQAARRHFDQRSGAFRQAIRATSASRRKSEAARSEAEAARLAAEGARSTYAGKLAELESLQGQFEAWLASLAELKAGDPVPVPGRDRPGRLVRLQFNKQIAVVDFDNVQVEVPLADLMPDLGQSEARDQITSLRAQVLSQARQGEQLRQEAQRTHAEYQRALAQQRARQQQYERWLAEIASARVGQEVPIARPPGRGTLVELDFPRGQAKVQAGETAIELPVQDLFPQSGPFVHRQRGPEPRTEKPSRRDERPRPIPRRRPESAAAKANRQAVLATAPGQQVYVIPFRKRATLIRFNEDQDHALVQSGAFEVEVPVADLEPARERE